VPVTPFFQGADVMVKKLLFLAIFTTVIAIAISLSNPKVSSQTDYNALGQSGTLEGIAHATLARGENEVFLDEEILYEGVSDLNTAIARYTIVEATLVNKRSMVLGPFSVGTWYKFSLNRTIKQNPFRQCAECSPMPNPPADMAPNTSELSLILPSGIVQVNGVTIMAGVSNFPDFALNQKYLLFLNYDSSKRVGVSSVGPPGVYTVDAYGNLGPIFVAEASAENPIGEGLAAQYGNNSNNLNSALNPPSCDPAQEQYCYQRGGEWDSYNCSCFVDPCLRKPWLCDGGYNY
jgi:hypothetical protein